MQDKTKCTKCVIDGCKICDEISNNCIECKNNYKPHIDLTTKLIISCNLLCDLGKENKCLTCDMKEGKESNCGSCNEGYKLINGKCKKIENSFIGVYDVKSTSNFTKIIRLIGYYGNNIKLSDFNIYVNGEKVEPKFLIAEDYTSLIYGDYAAYIFPKLGKNEVKIIFNKILTNLDRLFENCYDLISIEFSETFDSSHVLSMKYIFSGCDSLEHVNISSLNTSITGDMQEMFSGCHSLTSLDLTNFDTRTVNSMQGMFASCDNLSYIDLSSFTTTYLEFRNYIFDDMGQNVTIIISKDAIIKYKIPNGWNVIYID